MRLTVLMDATGMDLVVPTTSALAITVLTASLPGRMLIALPEPALSMIRFKSTFFLNI